MVFSVHVRIRIPYLPRRSERKKESVDIDDDHCRTFPFFLGDPSRLGLVIYLLFYFVLFITLAIVLFYCCYSRYFYFYFYFLNAFSWVCSVGKCATCPPRTRTREIISWVRISLNFSISQLETKL